MHIPKLRCQEPVGPCSACKERPQLASPAQVEKPEGPSRGPAPSAFRGSGPVRPSAVLPDRLCLLTRTL